MGAHEKEIEKIINAPIEAVHPSINAAIEASSGSSFPRLIVVPAVCFLAADKHEIDGVRKEKERLTAASISC